MLRSQEVPARLAVGYTPGEPVGNNQWVVRGVDSHAWVEVYFPEIGWVEFDPTPTAPREATGQARVDEAVAAGEATVGTGTTGGAEAESGRESRIDAITAASNRSETSTGEIEGVTDARRAEVDAAGNQNQTPAPVAVAEQTDANTDTGVIPVPFAPPPQQQLALWAIVLGGVVAGVRRSSIHTRLAWAVRLRVQPQSGDPAVDIERAHDQLLYILQQRYRQRRPGETMRAYVTDIGASSDARRIVRLRERARYGDETVPTDRHVEDAFKRLDRIRRA